MDQVDEEVEALTFTYDGVSWDADTRTLSLPLLPSAEQHDGRVYLRCDLQFDLSGYPRRSPSARLTNAKGRVWDTRERGVGWDGTLYSLARPL